MALFDFLKLQSAETGITEKHDRRHKFRLTRKEDGRGFQLYVLENTATREKIVVKRFIFDRFRGIIRDLLNNEINAENPAPFDKRVTFKDKTHFLIRSTANSPNQVILQESTPTKGTTGYLVVERDSVEALDRLLFHELLRHPNDVLNRIVSYHKLFNFTFAEGSDSITSDLTVRKDVLSQVGAYKPALGKRVGMMAKPKGEGKDDNEIDKTFIDEAADVNKTYSNFKSKLAQRTGEKEYQVDYDSLFSRKNANYASKNPKAPSGDPKKSDGEVSKSCFPLPVMASEIKACERVPFKCELSQEEAALLSNVFLGKRRDELFLGFEIVDAIFRSSAGNLKSFQFPLYYMRVSVLESGRSLFIEPSEDQRLYLNHLALSNMMETFGRGGVGKDPVERFFSGLLAQNIEVDKQLGRIYLSRMLPFNEQIFEKTREVLLGQPGENGMGGMFSDLKVIGIECDLEAVNLYKAAKLRSPTAEALEADLDHVIEIAHDNPSRFYNSLLGKFLSPEGETKGRKKKKGVEKFCDRSWMPEAPSKSMTRLLDRLNNHDLMLLEGPPGTGKTYSITNLFLHCVNSGKRLLIVSDQKGGINALTEKIQEYLMDKDRDSAAAKNMEILWKTAIKVVDDIPTADDSMSKWVRELATMLNVLDPKELDWPAEEEGLEAKIIALDDESKRLKDNIKNQLLSHLGPESDIRRRVSPKRYHATTVDDISSMVSFLKFMGHGTADAYRKDSLAYRARRRIFKFIKDREYIARSDLKSCYDFFHVPEVFTQEHFDALKNTEKLLRVVQDKKPIGVKQFRALCEGVADNQIINLLFEKIEERYPIESSNTKNNWNGFLSFFSYPISKTAEKIRGIIINQLRLFELASNVDKGVWQQIREIHLAMTPDSTEPIPVSLEICRFTVESSFTRRDHDAPQDFSSIQEHLEDIARIQKERDELIRKRFIGKMGNLARLAFRADAKGGTNPSTAIASLLESLKDAFSVEAGAATLKELQEVMFESFPIWICRKQAVPFLFPCVEQSFDLIVVDEATQCRVDDALPLLYRAKKLLVVGDDKQTVLQKNSTIDDYLFREFNLDEHLRTTRARHIKGGGSNIFSLVKGIKQASVMLEEHYRCPPDIIEFSNKYVYRGELKKMQWTPTGSPRSVWIDHSEADAASSPRRDSGKYKGTETKMIDRFLEYVGTTIKSIEKETGTKINIETEVALCYFLIKNDTYVKDKKHEWLRLLRRGEDVLEGAGAALQGKEREYIFYLWDVNRWNMNAFRQGDDPDKRKGELNVLMSRPKRRAYHFLHKNFAGLDHHKTTITDYLWKTYQEQSEQTSRKGYIPRTTRPGPQFIPWRRSSGELLGAIFDAVLEKRKDRLGKYVTSSKLSKQPSIEVGDPQFKVDLMLRPDGIDPYRPGVGLVDLCQFETHEECAEDLVDYYFQLQRASPPIKPVFMFIHELADENSRAFERMLATLKDNI